MRARKLWGQLTPSYRARMVKHGATADNWATFDRTAARGHARTPEHPREAIRRPDKFPEYVAKRKPKEAPAQSIADQVVSRKRRIFGDYIKFNGTNSARAVRRNPVTKRPPDRDRMARFLRMKADELALIEWSDNEWAFLYYH